MMFLKLFKNTGECSEICPVFAVVMVKEIDEEAVHYPKDVLRLQEDVPGSMLWAVALDKTMMTIRVNPNCHFENTIMRVNRLHFIRR